VDLKCFSLEGFADFVIKADEEDKPSGATVDSTSWLAVARVSAVGIGDSTIGDRTSSSSLTKPGEIQPSVTQ